MRFFEKAVLLSLSAVMPAVACGGESDAGDEAVAGKGGAAAGASSAGAGAAMAGRSGAAGTGGTQQGGTTGTSGRSGAGAAGESGSTAAGSGGSSLAGTGGGIEGGEAGASPGAGTNGGGSAGAASGLVTCDPRLIMCRRVAPTCEAGEVPSVEGTCYGPCVAIERCACDGPDACPNEETYTCYNSSHHCGPYLR